MKLTYRGIKCTDCKKGYLKYDDYAGDIAIMECQNCFARFHVNQKEREMR